ncbi:MAG: RNA polymerase sigma factor [Candidatus Paceibacteria bacterium]
MGFFSMPGEQKLLSDYTDTELLYLSKDKPWLFSELVYRYQTPFLRRATRIIQNQADAEEIVQDAFTKIYIHSHTFIPQTGATFSSWAYRILLNTAFTYYKKRIKEGGRFTMLDPEFEALVIDGSESLSKRENTDAVARVLQLLPSHFAQVLRLHYLERWPHQAIADHTGDTISSIKVRIHRAKTAYKKEQAKINEEPVL